MLLRSIQRTIVVSFLFAAQLDLFIMLRLVVGSLWMLSVSQEAARGSILSPRYRNESKQATASSASAIGDYIAAGLNLRIESSSEHSQPTTSSSTGKVVPTSSQASARQASTVSAANFSSANANATQPDQCWSEWLTYWNSSSSKWTISTTLTTTMAQESYSDWWETYELTTTETAMNGNFPTKTYETVITTDSFHVTPYTTGSTTLVTTMQASVTITPPPCALPTYVSQCQSAWAGWINGETWNSPDCTQATITGSLCESVQSSWLQTEGVVGEIDGKVGERLTTFTSNGTREVSSWWPSTSILAPGCSVGCQSCRVSGSNVKLLYWPPATTSNNNGTFHAITSSNNTGVVTAVAHGTTLTSPTVYISFDRLYASDSCSVSRISAIPRHHIRT